MFNCKMIGYKEGDRFIVGHDTGLYSVEVGDKLILIKDDGSFAPFFAIEGTSQVTCVPLRFLQKLDNEEEVVEVDNEDQNELIAALEADKVANQAIQEHFE